MALPQDLHDAAEVPVQARGRPIDAYGGLACVDMLPSCVSPPVALVRLACGGMHLAGSAAHCCRRCPDAARVSVSLLRGPVRFRAAMVWAASSGDLDTVRQLVVERGVDANAADAEGA